MIGLRSWNAVLASDDRSLDDVTDAEMRLSLALIEMEWQQWKPMILQALQQPKPRPPMPLRRRLRLQGRKLMQSLPL